jgi:hypothetical protein
MFAEDVDEKYKFAGVPPPTGRPPDIGMVGCCGRKEGDAVAAGGYPLIGVDPAATYELLAAATAVALSNVNFIAGLTIGRFGRGGGIADLKSLSKCLIGRASRVFGVPGGLKYVNDWGWNCVTGVGGGAGAW